MVGYIALGKTGDPASPPVSLPTIAVFSTSSGTQSNLIVDFGLPLPYGTTLTSGHRIVMYDGNTPLTTQDDNRYSDRSGMVRGLSITCLIPSLAAGQRKELTPRIVLEAPSTLPTKTAAQLLLLNADLEVTVNTNDGTARSAKLRDALGGSSTWSNGSPQCKGFWRDGTLVKELICVAPQKTSGGTADAQLRTNFHVSFYSADNFATIQKARVIVITENGFINTGIARADRVFDSASITTGIASPVTAVSYTHTTPATDLVLTGTGITRTLTGAVGTFTKAHLGQTIVCGSDRLQVCSTTGAGGNGSVCTGFFGTAPVASTFVNGTWKLCEKRVIYRGSWMEEVWYGTQSKYEIYHKPRAVKDSYLVVNYAYPGQVTFGLDNTINNVGDGRMELGSASVANNQDPGLWAGGNPVNMGERLFDGNEPESRLYPNFQLTALLCTDTDGYYTSLGRYRIFNTTHRWMQNYTVACLDANTGLLINPTDFPSFIHNDVDDASKQPSPDLGTFNPDWAHHENMGYLPYILTGQFRYLQDMHTVAQRTWWDMSNTGLANTGWNRAWWRSIQIRTMFWNDRDMVYGGLCTPDNIPSGLLSWSKSNFRSLAAYNWDFAVKFYIDDGTGHTGWSKIALAGPDNRVDGPLYLNHAGLTEAGGFMFSYGVLAGHAFKELGELDTNGIRMYTRIQQFRVDQYTHPEILAHAGTDADNINEMFGKFAAVVATAPYDSADLSWTNFYASVSAQAFSQIYSAYEYAGMICIKEDGWVGPTETIDLIIDTMKDTGEASNCINFTAGGLPDRTLWNNTHSTGWATYWREWDIDPRS